MIKLLPLILFVSIAPLLYAGDSTQVKTFNRLYAGASFTPGMSYRYLSHNKALNNNIPAVVQDQILAERKKNEHPGFGFSAGLRLGVNINSFISLETGLDYTRYAYNYQPALFLGSQWNGSGFDSSTTYKLKSTYVFHYLNVPLGLNLTWGKKKVKALISAGASFDFFIQENSTDKIYLNNRLLRQHNIAREIPANTFNFSPFLGAGVAWNINHFMFLKVLPMARIQALNNINGAIAAERLWSVGINASLCFGFLKGK